MSLNIKRDRSKWFPFAKTPSTDRLLSFSKTFKNINGKFKIGAGLKIKPKRQKPVPKTPKTAKYGIFSPCQTKIYGTVMDEGTNCKPSTGLPHTVLLMRANSLH